MKFIWGFRWYEYSQFYQTNKFLLTKMISHFEASKIQYYNMENDVYYMRLCVKLIDRLESQYYEERAEEELEKRWGKYRNIKYTVEDGDINVRVVTIKRELEKTEEDTKRYSEDFRTTYKFWRNKEEKSRRLLFNILNNKLENWWI